MLLRTIISLCICIPAVGIWGCRAIERTVRSGPSIEARRLSREGLAAVHQQRWDEAEELFESALALSRTDDRAHWGFAEVLWHRGLRGDAIEHMEQSVRLSGGSAESRIRLGEMYLDEGHELDAMDQAEKVLKKERSFANAWALKGGALVLQEKFDQALVAYHRALSITPGDPKVQIAIARLYKSNNRYDRVLASIERMPEDSDDLAEIELLRGIALRELGRPHAGLQQFRNAIARGLNSPESILELAKTQLACGDHRLASHTIGPLIANRPFDQEAIQVAQAIEIEAAKRSRLPNQDQELNR